MLENVPRSFEGIRDYLKVHYIEGIVFWKDGEPQCKIKRSDFGFEWNSGAKTEGAKKNDTVYILGDIAYRTPVVEVNQLISRLNGKKILCRGNHDKKYDIELFEGIYDFLEIAVNGINVSLMHYPMMSWPKSHHGSLHLHGHIHSRGDYNLQQKSDGILRYDGGVDANIFYPVSIDQVKEFFEMGL